MTTPTKFMFEVDFGQTSPAEKSEPTITVSAHEAALTAATTQAYRDGSAAAELKATADAQRSTAAAFERIAQSLGVLIERLDDIKTRLETDGVDVALAVARKLAPELISREPLAEITALLGECFTHLVGAPHVVIRIEERLYSGAAERLDAMARARGFAGRVVVLADPDIKLGDCRVEWADGGVIRNRAATEACIDDLIGRYLAGRPVGANPLGSGKVAQ